MSIINTLVQFAFLYGSVLFLSSDVASLKLGDELFIVGSVITFVFAAYNLIESRAHWMHYFDAEREDRIEFWEVSMFFVAGLVFMVGSFFYWPGIYEIWCPTCTEHEINDMEFTGESWGAFLFVMGSMLFVGASMFNAIGLGMNKYEDDRNNQVHVAVHYLHIVALIASQLGSTCFVVGSFLYRPVFPACPSLTERYAGEAQAGQAVAEEACESTGTAGTWLYIYGSSLYCLEALLNFASSALKGASLQQNGKVGSKEIPAEESSGEE